MVKAKKKDSEERNYLFDINNPEKHGLTWESTIEIIRKFKPYYFCISYEKGLKKHTPHYHIFFMCKSPVRFSTWKKRFPSANKTKDINGTPNDCRNYVLKIGKWENNPKADTSIKTYEEGEIPKSAKNRHSEEKAELLEQIKSGMSNMEIVEKNSKYLFKMRDMDTIRTNYLVEKYSKEFRDVKTIFIYGSTGTYKTSYVYKSFDSKDIFRIHNYQNLNSLWNGYSGQKVVLFDEFTGQIPIELMLILTDKFPILNLTARYNNKIAMYEYVFFCSNTNYNDIYKNERAWRTSTYKAWDRRIQNVWEFQKNIDGTPKVIIHKGNVKEEDVYELQNKEI